MNEVCETKIVVKLSKNIIHKSLKLLALSMFSQLLSMKVADVIQFVLTMALTKFPVTKDGIAYKMTTNLTSAYFWCREERKYYNVKGMYELQACLPFLKTLKHLKIVCL